MCAGGKGGTDNSSQQAADAEAQRQRDVTWGTNRVNKTFDRQFGSDYYGKLQQGYLDYANPQLDSQYQNTQKNLTYALARDGNLNSSTSADQQAGLAKDYNANKLGLANTAETMAN